MKVSHICASVSGGDIYRTPGEKPILKAKVIGTPVDEMGIPMLPKELEGIFGENL